MAHVSVDPAFEESLQGLGLGQGWANQIRDGIIAVLERDPFHFREIPGTNARVGHTIPSTPSVQPYRFFYTVDEDGNSTLRLIERILPHRDME